MKRRARRRDLQRKLGLVARPVIVRFVAIWNRHLRRRPRRLVVAAILMVVVGGLGLRWMLTDMRGGASYYADAFDGRPTASGEPFDMYAMTAAHRRLPLGTMVRVKNLDNGREVVVRINDRGPYVRGRVIDLSYGAARELGMLDAGLAHVELERVK